MRKFNIQDRIVLDEMIDAFKKELIKTHVAYKLENKRPIITQQYWEQMIDEVQSKIDSFTTRNALEQSNKYR
jgi:hypothetical protein|tara:strand:+ start:451 stop:666 length:216 start_codon:yes stop_codon:yes gene_type:complete